MFACKGIFVTSSKGTNPVALLRKAVTDCRVQSTALGLIPFILKKLTEDKCNYEHSY